MKLAIAVLFALVCVTIADDAVKACADTEHWFDGTKCNACTAPCKSCTGKDNKEWCLDCGANGGKYLADGKCSDCIKDCTACRGGAVGDCQTPAADMKVGPSSIVKCTGLTGCLYCSAENKCGKCQAGYQLKEDKCTPCTGNTCVDCTADVAKCTKCAYWNTLKDGACTACDNGCKDCPCTGCKSGYAFKDAKCTPCTDAFNCMECAADAGKCTKCAFGFLKDDKCNACSDANCVTCTGADQCSTCRAGYALKDGKTCVKCPDDCETCDADAKCSKCKANFYINADKKCTGCGVGCDGCGTDGTCTKCVAGTWLATDKKSCLACGLSCQECADDKKCKTCVASAVIKDGVCKDASTCAFGQMIKDDQTCVAGTIVNCAQGNGVAGTCPYCAPGFYTKDKTCANCPAGCKACAPDAKGYVKCSSFGQDGYSFTNDTNAKIDKTGYLGKDATYTLNFDGSDNKCMPNTWSATYTLNPFKHKCIAYDSCTMIVGQSPFSCLIEGNAVKMTLSLFAVVIASLFTL